MNVILAVDAVMTPLTGIGRYALELAQRLPKHPLVGQLRLFSMGRWLDGADLARLAPAGRQSGAAPTSPWPGLRSRLAGNRLAVRAYHALSSPVYGWQLRAEKGSLFHSPNYFLPPFPGRSVATTVSYTHLTLPTNREV